ncbi:wee1-like protein kinase [Cydia amplana]|uniref:wee1-like protein kinase n=1 Tax=Cydia amplana TaxID=1869771 RepID=UPI002FE553A7
MTEWYRMNTGLTKHNSTELSEEMSDSFNTFSENLSPIPPVFPRKLDFSYPDDEEKVGSPAPSSMSPPYRKVRALRLFDSPRTPKSLLEKCSTPSHNASRSRLFPPKLNVPCITTGSSHHLHPPDEDSALGSMHDDSKPVANINPFTPDGITTGSSHHLHPPDEDSALGSMHDDSKPVANINPFTPDGQALNKKKRALSKTPTSMGDATPEQPAKRLRESNISRYNVEFIELDVIGRGEFGRVTRCVNKLDGCVYALKRSLRPVAGSAQERAALTEVYAHAVLGKHPRVVRYYSAWAEDDHMIIQNEYCSGGSLQQMMETGPLPETELLLLLAHVADGLAYIHSLHLVHMDVKPGNIFVCSREGEPAADSDDDDYNTNTHIYKIGDLGHVTCVSSPRVEEGDCRYLTREIIQEDLTHLTKSDIFAFGLTLFEAAGGGPLPKNGPAWHALRDGQLPELPGISREFHQLIQKMIDPDPNQRPSASRLRKHPLLHPAGNKSKTQLTRELAAAKLKNELLTKKLDEYARCIKSLTPGRLVTQDSAKFRTRSAKRMQKPREQFLDAIQNMNSPIHCLERRTDRRKKV